MRKTSLDLPYVLVLKLESYVNAIGACKSKVARIAIENHIDRALKNPATKKSYEEQRALLLAAAGNNIELIGARRKPRKKPTPVVVDTGAEIQSKK